MDNKFEANKGDYSLEEVLNHFEKYVGRIGSHIGHGDYGAALFLLDNIGDEKIDKSALYLTMAFTLQSELDNKNQASGRSIREGKKSYDMAKALVDYCLGKSEKYMPKTEPKAAE